MWAANTLTAKGGQEGLRAQPLPPDPAHGCPDGDRPKTLGGAGQNQGGKRPLLPRPSPQWFVRGQAFEKRPGCPCCRGTLGARLLGEIARGTRPWVNCCPSIRLFLVCPPQWSPGRWDLLALLPAGLARCTRRGVKGVQAVTLDSPASRPPPAGPPAEQTRLPGPLRREAGRQMGSGPRRPASSWARAPTAPVPWDSAGHSHGARSLLLEAGAWGEASLPRPPQPAVAIGLTRHPHPVCEGEGRSRRPPGTDGAWQLP